MTRWFRTVVRVSLLLLVLPLGTGCKPASMDKKAAEGNKASVMNPAMDAPTPRPAARRAAPPTVNHVAPAIQGPTGAVLGILQNLKFGETTEAQVQQLIDRWRLTSKRKEQAEPKEVVLSLWEGPRKKRQKLPAKAHSIEFLLRSPGKAPARLAQLTVHKPPFGQSICRTLAPHYVPQALTKCRYHRAKKDKWRYCLPLAHSKRILVMECSYNKEEGDALEVRWDKRE